MEEVDNIIIHSLRQIGCDIREDITNLSGFNTELVIKATVKCLEIIRPDIEILKISPVNMAARFRLSGNLAQACSELGYTGDIGYQTFLYSSETDLRRVLIFLIEKLPKECDKGIGQSINKLDKLEKNIAAIVFKQLNTPWLPHYCHKQSQVIYTRMPYKNRKLLVPILNKKNEFKEYYTEHRLTVPNRLENSELLLSSLIFHNTQTMYCKSTNTLSHLEWLNNRLTNKKETLNKKMSNSTELKLMSRFSLNERLQEQSNFNNDQQHSTLEIEVTKTQMLPVKTKGEVQQIEIEQLKEDCDKLRMNINNYHSEIKQLMTQHSQSIVCQKHEEKELKLMEQQQTIKARIYDLLKDGENNTKKMQSVIESEKNKLIGLAIQWERHRVTLIQKYQDEKKKYSVKANTSQKKLNELRLMRDKERELRDECKMKDQQYSQLLIDVQKKSKEINRSAYTQRILEIINNVKKQKDEIHKVLDDTREIQKEINMLSGKLERSFAVVDELIFRDAKTTEASRRAYKLLATLHSDCNELVTLVEETGTTLREIRDLEEQIDFESTKNIEANLQRIAADLEQMRQESALLMAQLANKNS